MGKEKSFEKFGENTPSCEKLSEKAKRFENPGKKQKQVVKSYPSI